MFTIVLAGFGEMLNLVSTSLSTELFLIYILSAFFL